MPFEDFLDVYCDRCGSNFQSTSYHGVIDIVREHLLRGLNICKVENMKISSKTENRDLNSLSSSPRLTIINSVVE
jgi:hypothetical protein